MIAITPHRDADLAFVRDVSVSRARRLAVSAVAPTRWDSAEDVARGLALLSAAAGMLEAHLVSLGWSADRALELSVEASAAGQSLAKETPLAAFLPAHRRPEEGSREGGEPGPQDGAPVASPEAGFSSSPRS